MLGEFVGWFVDLGRLRDGQDLGRVVGAESLGEAFPGRVQHRCSLDGLRRCEAVVDVCWRVEADSGVAMFVVVIARAGWRARRRRSLTCLFSFNTRRIVEMEHKYVPASSSCA